MGFPSRPATRAPTTTIGDIDAAIRRVVSLAKQADTDGTAGISAKERATMLERLPRDPSSARDRDLFEHVVREGTTVDGLNQLLGEVRARLITKVENVERATKNRELPKDQSAWVVPKGIIDNAYDLRLYEAAQAKPTAKK